MKKTDIVIAELLEDEMPLSIYLEKTPSGKYCDISYQKKGTGIMKHALGVPIKSDKTGNFYVDFPSYALPVSEVQITYDFNPDEQKTPKYNSMNYPPCGLTNNITDDNCLIVSYRFKPCPFCGKKPGVDFIGGMPMAACKECGAAVYLYDKERRKGLDDFEALLLLHTKWNRRA